MPGKAKPAAKAGARPILSDWRAETLERVRALIFQADPDVVEEVKWRKPSNAMQGVPTWSHDGLICTGETYKDKVKLTFARGAALEDPTRLFNADDRGSTRRAIDLHEGQTIDPAAFKALVKAAVAMNGRQTAAKGKTQMAKATLKTKPTTASVEAFLNGVKDERQRKDSFVLLEMMKKATGEEPKMWGSSIIGFGMVTVKSPATGREVDWLRIGFAPRKGTLSLYITGDIQKYAAALKKLGKHKTGMGCLYIKRLDDVDLKVLKGMVERALKVGHFG